MGGVLLVALLLGQPACTWCVPATAQAAMFVNTLSIVFNLTSLLSELEALLLLSAVFALAYLSTPGHGYSRALGQYGSLYGYLLSAWLGRAELWRVFWPFFVLVNAVLVYIDYRVANLTFTIASWKTVHGMLLLPMVWWLASLWRCSLNTRRRAWAALARAMAACLVVEFVSRLALSHYYPNAWFDCRLLVIEYGDCF